MKTFEEVWKEKEAEGYQYGADALEQVRFGWELAMKEIEQLRDHVSELHKNIVECENDGGCRATKAMMGTTR